MENLYNARGQKKVELHEKIMGREYPKKNRVKK